MKYVATQDGNWIFKKDFNNNIVMTCAFDKLSPTDNGYIYSRQATKEEIQRLHKAYLLANTDWIVIKGFHIYFCMNITINANNMVYAGFIKDLIDGIENTSREVISLANISEVYTKEEALKLFPEIKNLINMKPELKPGMIVEYNNGEKRLCIEFEGKLALISTDGYCSDTYEMFNSSNHLYIVKIYKPHYLSNLNTLLNNPGELIWPKEVKELTLQEIANKFNIDVSQLRIKE